MSWRNPVPRGDKVIPLLAATDEIQTYLDGALSIAQEAETNARLAGYIEVSDAFKRLSFAIKQATGGANTFARGQLNVIKRNEQKQAASAARAFAGGKKD